MKAKQSINTLLFVIAVLVFTITVSAQEHNHNKKDSTKTEMHHHDMKSDDNKMSSDTLQTSKPWNAVCPVMGEDVDPEAGTVIFEGKAYGFCCKSCDSKFKKDPAKYSKNLSEDGKTFLKGE